MSSQGIFDFLATALRYFSGMVSDLLKWKVTRFEFRFLIFESEFLVDNMYTSVLATSASLSLLEISHVLWSESVVHSVILEILLEVDGCNALFPGFVDGCLICTFVSLDAFFRQRSFDVPLHNSQLCKKCYSCNWKFTLVA